MPYASHVRAIRMVGETLKPGGGLVTSTARLSDGYGWLCFVAWAGRMIGKMPLLAFFSRDDLRCKMPDAGLPVEENWAPGPSRWRRQTDKLGPWARFLLCLRMRSSR